MQRDAIPLEDYRRGEWGDPKSLPTLLPKAPSLTENMVPESLRPWILDAGDRAQLPLEFLAVPAIVAASSILGRSIGISPKAADDWVVIPNLWGGLVARPGTMKSPAINEALRPIRRLTAKAQEAFEVNTDTSDARGQILKAEQSALQDQAKAAAKAGDQSKLTGIEGDLIKLNTDIRQAVTAERRYIVNDSTVEKLGALLNENPRGLLLVRDELFGWLRGLDKAGREGDREFYLEAWNGTGEFTYDRIGRGTLHIESLCLSILGTIQPSKLQGYINSALTGGIGDDGLLQRFQLLVWPDVSPTWRNIDRKPDLDARDTAFDIFDDLDRITPDVIGAVCSEDEIPVLRFSEGAQEMFDSWRDTLENRMRSGETEDTPAFESHLAKYRSLMPSLALIFHLVEVVSGRDSGAVSSAVASLAIEWCAFLEVHARKVYAAEINSDLTATHMLAEKIKSGRIENGQAVRDIYRAGWTGLATVEAVHEALDLAERHNLIRIEKTETGGRPCEVIQINPKWKISPNTPNHRTDRTDKSPSVSSVSSMQRGFDEKEGAIYGGEMHIGLPEAQEKLSLRQAENLMEGR